MLSIILRGLRELRGCSLWAMASEVRTDAAVVGGGPAGLAAAICAAKRGLSVVVIEASRELPDKACGEGLMPSGVRALDEMGALALIDPDECAPFSGIRYIQEDGSSVEGEFRSGKGMGIRRIALVKALEKRALELGVEMRHACKAIDHRLNGNAVVLKTDSGDFEARILIAADGLNSPIRRRTGFDMPASGPRRFGMRRHFRVPVWSRFVEVYWSDGAEAYVTPAGASRVGVAFLWEDGRLEKASFDALLERFPSLAEKIKGAETDSEVRGAGPFLHSARSRVSDGLVLIGDAAGYVDAITGEGLSTAFTCASALGEILPEALAQGARRSALEPYERAFKREFRAYAISAKSVLAISRRCALRRLVLRFLSRHPSLFETLMNRLIG